MFRDYTEKHQGICKYYMIDSVKCYLGEVKTFWWSLHSLCIVLSSSFWEFPIVDFCHIVGCSRWGWRVKAPRDVLLQGLISWILRRGRHHLMHNRVPQDVKESAVDSELS